MLQPAVLSTKEAYAYCGNQPIWEELLEHHSNILQPLRRNDRGDTFYLRTVIDAALAAAQHQQTLVKPLRKKPVARASCWVA
jgi:hypothetical protein